MYLRKEQRERYQEALEALRVNKGLLRDYVNSFHPETTVADLESDVEKEIFPGPPFEVAPDGLVDYKIDETIHNAIVAIRNAQLRTLLELL